MEGPITFYLDLMTSEAATDPAALTVGSNGCACLGIDFLLHEGTLPHLGATHLAHKHTAVSVGSDGCAHLGLCLIGGNLSSSGGGGENEAEKNGGLELHLDLGWI